MLGPVAGGLAAIAVGALRNGPSLPPPTPASSQPAPPTSAPRQGVPHGIKLRTPVLLGLLTRGRLTSYCRATYGPGLTAALDDGDWTCRPPATGRGLIDMDAVCRWRYGDGRMGRHDRQRRPDHLALLPRPVVGSAPCPRT
jgi:hypothetical protein